MELVNEWFPTWKIRKVDKTFRTDSTYENELMDELLWTRNALRKSEMEYHGKFGHTIGKIQHIALMSKIEICYTDWRLETQTMTPTLPGIQAINQCIKFLASDSHKRIFYPFNYHDDSNFTRLTWRGNKVEDYTTHNCLEWNKFADHARIINIRWSVSGIMNNFLGVAVCWKVQIQPDVASETTDG